eukprot:Seg1379.3 transcript_id=Seg1379.3/GoldUCD/mRNA.D3Y31 product="hypothetical protein" protein_id=Seg1379.3/GoldUCD/D3Y31
MDVRTGSCSLFPLASSIFAGSQGVVYETSNVYQEFLSGKFTVQKTSRKFSSMATDLAHEQNNKLFKEEGGVIGILQSPKALMQWMVAGSEIARMIAEFGDIIVDADPEEPIKKHHENTHNFSKVIQERCYVDARGVHY